jgi:glycosyltransferase involved in cell wall biosynthesis
MTANLTRPQVVHVTPSIARESSGATYAVVRYHESLLAQGYQSVLTALDWPGQGRVPESTRLFRLGIGPKRLGRSPDMLRWLRAAARANHNLVIHNHGMWQASAWYASRVGRCSDRPVVISPHGTFGTAAFIGGSWIKRVVWPAIQRPLCQLTTCFHATALSEADDIRRLGFTQPIAVIPIGIDVPIRFTPDARRTRTALFLGRIHPKKNIPALLRAWKVVQRHCAEWSLDIVGSDAGYYGASGHLSDLKRLSHELGLERVNFLGDMHGDVKRRMMMASSVFVLPTKDENFGIAVAEALACGMPAIVTKGAPWQGLIDHRAGWWIDFGVDALVHALRQALTTSPDELAAMGSRGRDWMMRDFSWEVVGAKMAETYRWLGGDSPKPAWVV